MFPFPNNAGGAPPSNLTPSNLTPSNLTPSNTIPSHTPAHLNLSQALGEIDGFLAGMRYFDETEPLKASELGDSFSKSTTPPPPDPKSADQRALSSIRDVRDGTQSGWKHFEKVLPSLDVQVVNRLRHTYHDAKGLREAGVFAFRDIMAGDARNNLETFFAFCSLSYVVSGLLHKRGKFDKTSILGGLPVWLGALEVQGDQEAFQKLARDLWPEASPPSFQLDTLMAILSDSSHASAPNPSFDESSSAFSLASQSSTLPSPQAPHFPNFDHDMVLNQFGTQSLGALSFGTPSAPNQCSSALDVVSPCIDNFAGLRATKIFDAVVQYCRDNGDFWYDLSGRGMISKNNESCCNWNRLGATKKRSIHKQYLARLLLEKDKKDITSRGIVSVVEEFVDMGYLQSPEEAKRYMAHIASSLFRDGKSQGKFITWVNSPPKLFLCLTCQKGFPRKGNMERHSKKCSEEAQGGRRQRQDARRAHPYR